MHTRGVWLLFTALLLVSVGARAQEPPDPATVARLNAVAATLFGPSAGTGAGSVDQAVAELKTLLATNPALAEAHFLLGAAYTLGGSTDMLGEAKAELRQAIALKPGMLQARVYLAGVYMQLGRAALARQELRTALEQAPGHPDLLTQLAEAERQSGDAAAALDITDRVLAGDATRQQAHYHRALALIDLGRPSEAASELAPLAAAGVPEPQVYLTLGRLQLEAGQAATALATLQQGLTLAAGQTDLQVLLARAFRLTGALARAESVLAAAQKTPAPAVASAAYQQTEADLTLERGLLRLAQGRPAEALTALEQSVEMRPDSGEAQRGLAIACLRSGHTDRAAAHAALAAKLGSPLPQDELARLRAAGGAAPR